MGVGDMRIPRCSWAGQSAWCVQWQKLPRALLFGEIVLWPAYTGHGSVTSSGTRRYHCSWSGAFVCLCAFLCCFVCLLFVLFHLFCFTVIFFYFVCKQGKCNPSLLQTCANLCYHTWLSSPLWICYTLPISYRVGPEILSWRVQSSIHSSLTLSHISFPFFRMTLARLCSPESWKTSFLCWLNSSTLSSGYRMLGQLSHV